MCGRYFLHAPVETLEVLFQARALMPLAPRYNIAPGTPVAVVVATPGGRVLAAHRWGLVPGWAKDPAVGARMINARSETAAEKPAFRSAFRQGRCILPANGFYEWQAGPGRNRQPFCFQAADGSVLGLAGLRSRWEGPDGVLDTCAILTTAANAVMAPVHDRMPVILAPGDYAAWLDPQARPEAVRALLRPCPDPLLAAHPVDPRVGNPRVDDPGLIGPPDPGLGLGE